MTFFEPPQPQPFPPEHRQPEWIGPANNILGVAVPLRIVLARNDQVALVITDATAFNNGVEFTLALRVRGLSAEARRSMIHGSPFHLAAFAGDPPSEEIPPEIVRFGVQLADGRKATNLDDRHWHSQDDPPGAVLSLRGGGGGDGVWDMRFWLWPLPPPGPLAFVAEWPLGGIALTRVEVDADPFLQAAAQAETLWPDGEPSSGSSWGATQVVVATSPDPAPENAPPGSEQP
jgi:hypothetical protein